MKLQRPIGDPACGLARRQLGHGRGGEFSCMQGGGLK
jgi:hypothetical protein